MSIIALPSSVRVRRIQWRLDRPAQVNRSAYTGVRRVVANPWHGKWSARVELAPMVGEANVRDWRGFLASLKGPINAFLLPAVEGAQHGVSNPTVGGSGAAQAATSLTLSSGFSFLGSNLVGDPGFDNASYWGAGTGWSISGSKANGSSANSYLTKTGVTPPTAGKTYKWNYDLVTRTAGSVRAYVGTAAVFGAAQSTAGTSPSGTFVATTGGEFGLNSNDGFSGTVDNFSIIEGVSLAPPLEAGMMVTVTLPSGNKQLVMLTADINGSNVITFEPPLREAVSAGAALETITPTCQVALTDSSFSWSVDVGRQYGIAFDTEEVF